MSDLTRTEIQYTDRNAYLYHPNNSNAMAAGPGLKPRLGLTHLTCRPGATSSPRATCRTRVSHSTPLRCHTRRVGSHSPAITGGASKSATPHCSRLSSVPPKTAGHAHGKHPVQPISRLLSFDQRLVIRNQRLTAQHPATTSPAAPRLSCECDQSTRCWSEAHSPLVSRCMASSETPW